ncbi:alpha/beta fold hydrolase [Maricaulis sp. CAU 1757]
MSVLKRNNVTVGGQGTAPIVFAHGFGCDQTMWRFIAPHFERDHKVVLFDLTGNGQSDLSAYDFDRYSRLDAHAEDIVDIISELDLEDVTLVGHSVSAITSALAGARCPERIARIVLVAPSPCFMNDGDYTGGFERAELEGLIAFMEENYLGWAAQLAPTIAGQPEGEPAAEDLTRSFCRTDPRISQHFGRVTFLSDRRDDMPKTPQPSLILQCDPDALAPVSVGEWMRDAMPDARLEVLPVTGHCPHMTAPDLTSAAIRRFIDEA